MKIAEMDYKGYQVWYEDSSDRWVCELGGKEPYSKENLSEIKKRIDDHIKKENVFKRIDAICKSRTRWDNSFGKIITITSIADDGDVWITDNGSRSKSNPKYYAKVTDENKAKVALVKEKEDQIKNLNIEIDNLIDSMELAIEAKAAN